MELAKLSRKGQLSIPKRLLKALGVEGEAYFLVELAPEGGLLLRPAGVYPLEVYTEERLQELLAEKGLTVDRRKIQLSEAIKTLGEHTVSIRLRSDVIAEFTVTVTASV